MNINDLMNSRGLSAYRLAAECGLSYHALLAIADGSSSLGRCSAETVYRIARRLDVSMEDLLASGMTERCSFECFRISVQRRIREIGDYAFILEQLDSDRIRSLDALRWHPECLYLLAMLDCQCGFHRTGIEPRYDDLRMRRLSEPLFPAGLRARMQVLGIDETADTALRLSIPEFRRFNIIETEVRHVY